MENNKKKVNEEKKSFNEMLKESKVSFTREIKNTKRWFFCGIELLFIIVAIATDMFTKQYIYTACKEQGEIVAIPKVLSFVAVENTGASFGMFSSSTGALTVVSTICAAVLVFFIFYSYKYRNLWLRSSLILITGGAIGNIVDRIMLGYVRDFISFDFLPWPRAITSSGIEWGSFAIFNFADCCLTVGTVVLLIYILFFYSKDQAFFNEQQNKAKQPVVASVEDKVENTDLTKPQE